MSVLFLPGVPGTTAGLCVGNGCPVIELVGNGCPAIEPVGDGCPVIEPAGNGCPVIEPVVDSVWESMLIILHSFNEMVVFT